MKKTEWKGVAELVGIAAIVASLIFVGLELQQQQTMARATHYQDRSFKAIDYYFSLMEIEPELKRRAVMIESINPDVLKGTDKEFLLSLPAEERVQNYMSGQINLFIWDNLLYQFEAGFLPESTWMADRARFKGGLTNTSFIRYEVEHNPERWRPELIEFAEELIREIDRGD